MPAGRHEFIPDYLPYLSYPVGISFTYEMQILIIYFCLIFSDLEETLPWNAMNLAFANVHSCEASSVYELLWIV